MWYLFSHKVNLKVSKKDISVPQNQLSGIWLRFFTYLYNVIHQ